MPAGVSSQGDSHLGKGPHGIFCRAQALHACTCGILQETMDDQGHLAGPVSRQWVPFIPVLRRNEKRRVLEDGPWFVWGKPLVLRHWTIDSKFERDMLSTIPIWVKFPKFSLQFWSPNLIGHAVSTLGVPLYMDKVTATGSRVDFAQVCIEIEASFSFPRTTHLEVDGLVEEIAVDYDWEPKPCPVCSSFGHEQGSCVSIGSLLANPQPLPATGSSMVGEAAAASGTSTSPILPATGVKGHPEGVVESSKIPLPMSRQLLTLQTPRIKSRARPLSLLWRTRCCLLFVRLHPVQPPCCYLGVDVVRA